MAWLTNWNYRKSISVSNTGTILNDYQIPITIDSATPISLGRMLSDGGDIRLTDSDGSSLLNHWIESGINTSSTKIWIKVPSIPTGTKAIYVYYGNSSATYDNSLGGNSTFEFFDDFNNNIIDTSKWTKDEQQGNTLQAINQEIRFGGTKIGDNWGPGARIDSVQTFSTSYIVSARAKLVTPSSYSYRVYLGIGNTTIHFYGSGSSDYDIFGWEDRGEVIYLNQISLNTWYNLKIVFDGTTYKNYVNDIYKGMTTSSLPGRISIRDSLYLNGTTIDARFDDIVVRKYAIIEPTTVIGTEEVVPGINWLIGWNIRKSISVSNTGTILTDHQIPITIDSATPISLGRMLPDGGDIRFTDSNGSSLLNHWIESGINTSSTKIWIKIPSIPTDTKTIYVYYGNPSTSYDNSLGGNNTFELFDNFNNNIIDTTKWTKSETNGLTVQAVNQEIKFGGIKIGSSWTTGAKIDSIRTFSTSFIVTARAKLVTPSTYSYRAYFGTGPSTIHFYGDASSADYDIFGNDDRGEVRYINQIVLNTWYNFKIVFDGTTYKNYVNDILRGTKTSTAPARISIRDSLYLNGTTIDARFDDVIVRKYAAIEPTTVFGTEELAVGNLDISSTPQGASIYINDVLQTGIITPITITGLTPGSHTYRLTQPGYNDVTGTFTIVASQTTAVSVTMSPMVGGISFSTIPEGAEIFLNDVDQNLTTPNTISNLVLGTYTYTLRLANYHDFTGTIDTIGNQTVNVIATLVPTFGSIAFTSSPLGAKIFIDDVDTGLITPFTIGITYINISEGTHAYKLTLPGYYDATGNVTVVGGQTSTVEETLTLITGDISFVSTPSGVEIFIDNVLQTGITTPYTVTGILPGDHTYTLRLANYRDYTGTTTVVGGQTSTITATLIPTFGNILFNSTPEGSKIFLDDIDTGQTTPTTITDVPEGTHTYRLVLAGYYDYIGTVTVTGGETAVVTATEVLITGEISFTSSPPGAKIIINDIDTGLVTPAAVTNMVPGTHMYTLSLAGYYDYTGSATVVGSETTSVTATLTLIVGSISFATVPSGAKIFIDNIDTGLATPSRVTDTIPGTHTYTLSLTGYHDLSGSATVIGGQTTTITETLTLIVGSISFVTIPPEAKVFIDNIDTGQITPVTITDLLPGNHIYTLKLSGYYDFTDNITVVGDQTVPVMPTLILITGTVIFGTNPAGAKIFLDDVDTGLTTPYTITNVVPGVHTYRFSLADYHDYSGNVSVVGEQTSTITIDLLPTLGNITFNTIPIGAKIFLDNVDTGLITPYTITNILEGTHSYILRLADYHDYSGSTTVVGGETTSITTTLLPTLGNISFNTTPAGANIFIDDVDTGYITPYTMLNILEGIHSYTLKLANYYDYTGSINVIAGQTVTVSETLVFMTGDISFNSIPSGAKIFIDSMDTDQTTPSTVANLPIGTHSYILKLANYYDYMGSIDVIVDQTVTVSETLVLMVGDISFNSIPSGASIFINGEDTHQVTPAIVTNLPIGTYTYALRLSCYEDYSDSITVLAGQTIPISAPLTLLTGNAYFNSTPYGAEIFIDGIDTGLTTPATVTNIYCGSHSYTLKSLCYQDYSGTVAILGNQTTNVTINLVPMLGSIYFTSTPSKARIFLDEIDTGQVTPTSITGVLACYHMYRLQLANHFDYIGTVNVIPNTIVNISVSPSSLETYCQEFASVPVGSRVTLDEYTFGMYTPVKVCGITAGTHTFRLEGTFNIGVGGKGCNPFNSVPKGSKIYIDNEYKGELTPKVICGISVGTHTYRLEGTFTI